MNTLTNFKKSLFGFSFVATTIIVAAALAFVGCGGDDGGNSTVTAVVITIDATAYAGHIIAWEAPDGTLSNFAVAPAAADAVDGNVSVAAPVGKYYKLVDLGEPEALTDAPTGGFYYGKSKTTGITSAENHLYSIQNVSTGATDYVVGGDGAGGLKTAADDTLYYVTDVADALVTTAGSDPSTGTYVKGSATSSTGITGTTGAVYSIENLSTGAVTYHVSANDIITFPNDTLVLVKKVQAAVVSTTGTEPTTDGTYYKGTATSSTGVTATNNVLYEIVNVATGAKSYQLGASTKITFANDTLFFVTKLKLALVADGTSALDVGSVNDVTYSTTAQTDAFSATKLSKVEVIKLADGSVVSTAYKNAAGDLAAPGSGNFAKVTYLLAAFSDASSVVPSTTPAFYNTALTSTALAGFVATKLYEIESYTSAGVLTTTYTVGGTSPSVPTGGMIGITELAGALKGADNLPIGSADANYWKF